MTYAIIESGGKQYRVQPGDTIEVEKLKVEPGATIDLERVLLLSDDDKITVGQPTVPGVKVVADVEEHGRGEKITVLKYKRKVRYSVKQGHRQSFTRLTIKDIVTGAAKPTRRRAAPRSKDDGTQESGG